MQIVIHIAINIIILIITEGSDEDICFELSEEDLANLKNGLGLTVNGQNVDITGFDEKFREEVKAAGFE